MPKKRKTRQEKIILQLKRELKKSTKFKPSQEAKSVEPQLKPKKELSQKKTVNSAFSYDPSLIKKDLTKTLILALIVISFELMLYLKLR
jgi:hypothetical protein